jgi:LmbE family N-acetylglucosaminyl deacetylase
MGFSALGTAEGATMFSLLDLTRVKHLLCLAAHCEDIEIGAGGTILRLVESQPQLEVRWIVLGGEDPERVNEARRSAGHFLAGVAKSEVNVYGFRDGFLPFEGEQVKETFDELRSSFQADLILTNHRDHHQDHCLVSQLTWNTWPQSIILEYEIAEYDGNFGNPNFFVVLSEDQCRAKISRLFESFPSQAQQPWFKEDVFWSKLRLRGVECNAPSRLAEAFFVRRLVA